MIMYQERIHCYPNHFINSQHIGRELVQLNMISSNLVLLFFAYHFTIYFICYKEVNFRSVLTWTLSKSFFMAFSYFKALPDLLTGLKVFSVWPFLGDVRCNFASLSLLRSSVFCSSCSSCAFPLSLNQCHHPPRLHHHSFHPTIYGQFARLVAWFSILSKFHTPFNHIYQYCNHHPFRCCYPPH